MSEPENLLSEWARLLAQAFVEAGVRDVVLSPGSRSTPFVLALTRHASLRCHDVVDERSAAFFALGMARAGSPPPLLLCTSGTAGAHYLPAVIEAGQSSLPLLVLTADRPFELQGRGAPQTIDQLKLFGDHVRAFVELGAPDESVLCLRALRRSILQAAHAALGPNAGAVHLNARARKPLEPSVTDGPAERALRDRVDRILASPPTEVYAARDLPDERGLTVVARACASARAGLIACGPAAASDQVAADAVWALAARTGFPVIAEAASGMRFGERLAPPPGVVLLDALDLVLGAPAFAAAAAPDLILQIGAPPTASVWDSYLAAHPDSPRWVIAPRGFLDPQSSAAGFLFSPIAEGLRALGREIAALVPGDPPASIDADPWRSRFARANTAARHVIATILDETPGLSEGEVARTVIETLPPRSMLMLGNSLPIRDVDLYAPAGSARCTVLSQRGANGIDGLVSGAAGAAAIHRAPTTLLVGDVSFLHDLGGLAVARAVATPLVIVVINNGGGRIFEQLPIARSPIEEGAIEHFTTPHEIGFAHAAALFGHRYALVESRADLARALGEAHRAAGCTIVEARVPPHSAREMLTSLRGRVDAALRTILLVEDAG